MRLRAVLFLTMWAVPAALPSCGLADPGQAPDTQEVDANGVGTPASTPASTIDDGTRVTLERTVCFGNCPVYSLSISGDGTVAYVGKQFVNVEGAASRQVPISEVQALVDEMLQADYFNLSVPDTCDEGVYSDAPSVKTSLTFGGRSHSLEDYLGNPCAPDGLRALYDAIDALADSAAWVACETPDGYCCGPGDELCI
jgi:hypothetical protein